jgi:hypothetical protein
MEELASAIVERINPVKLLFANASAMEDNTVAIDQESLIDGICEHIVLSEISVF